LANLLAAVIRADEPSIVETSAMPATNSATATVTPLRARSGRRRFDSTRVLQLAAALVVLAGIAVAVTRYSGDDKPTRELATAMMTDDGLPVATTETAQARVVCDGDNCAVEVDLSALPDAGADDLELWVINDDVTDMFSLGYVTENDGRFALPFGVTPEDFPIVDISLEPRDGVPTHSGQSVLRGVFTEG
jgi:hypothetical protein